MNDNKSAAELKASFIVVKQDSHFATISLPLQPSTPEQVVFFIGQGFNLDDKGDRFGQYLDLMLEVPKGDAILRWLGEEGWGGIMKRSTIDKGGP